MGTTIFFDSKLFETDRDKVYYGCCLLLVASCVVHVFVCICRVLYVMYCVFCVDLCRLLREHRVSVAVLVAWSIFFPRALSCPSKNDRTIYDPGVRVFEFCFRRYSAISFTFSVFSLCMTLIPWFFRCMLMCVFSTLGGRFYFGTCSACQAPLPEFAAVCRLCWPGARSRRTTWTTGCLTQSCRWIGVMNIGLNLAHVKLL